MTSVCRSGGPYGNGFKRTDLFRRAADCGDYRCVVRAMQFPFSASGPPAIMVPPVNRCVAQATPRHARRVGCALSPAWALGFRSAATCSRLRHEPCLSLHVNPSGSRSLSCHRDFSPHSLPPCSFCFGETSGSQAKSRSDCCELHGTNDDSAHLVAKAIRRFVRCARTGDCALFR